MIKLPLVDNISEEVNNKLKAIWDISKTYWYPLFDCKRNDLIALDSEYVERVSKLQELKHFLLEHNVKNVFEFREDGTSYEIIDFLDYELWLSEPYFWNNECFWFDLNMDWIIYVSHEGTTTFGGQWLVDNIKDKWRDWKENSTWDIKNK